MHRYCVLVGLLFLVIAQSASAAVDTTLTMDDLPNQPIHGLVHPSGVQFGFTVGGVGNADARYAAGGPGSLIFVQDPSIEGTTAGILSIIFPSPTTIVRFGVARNIFTPIPAGAAVQLFDAANASLGTTNLPFAPMPSFAEAQFNYSGAAVKRMTVDFTTASFAAGERFAFDNLTFRLVPEPSSAVLLLLGGLFLYGRSRRLPEPKAERKH